jgi:hypothetical protein
LDAEAVHLGKTEGFAAAFEPFENLILLAEKRPEMGSWDVTRAVTAAEFLAYWNGQPEKFENLRKKIKRHAKNHSYLKDRWGLHQFARIGSEHKKWNTPSFAVTRSDFLVKAFSRKEMTDYFGPVIKCFSGAVSFGNLRADIMKIAENPPEGIVPTALTQLLHYRTNEEFNAKRFDSAVAIAMKALQVCPEAPRWHSMRFEIQASLLDKLIANKKFDNAKEVYAGIKTDSLNDGQKNRYKVIGEKLNKAPQ